MTIYPAVTLAATLILPAAEGASPDKSLHRWIRDLGSDRFADRQAATRELSAAGSEAVARLTAAAERDESEVIQRCIGILYRLALSKHPRTAAEAKLALTELAQSKNAKTARRARAAIQARQLKVVTFFRNLGARVSSEGGTVTTIRFDGTAVRDEQLELLCEFPDITYLSLGSTQIGDAGMAHVSCLSKLQGLNLHRSQVGNVGLLSLKKLKHLVHLPMGETRVNDAGLVHLQDMTQLDYLGLRGNAVTDEGLVHLKKLKNLTGLYLGETRVTDKGLVRIRHMTKLVYLRLHTMRVSDAAVEHLRVLTNLRQIDIFKTQFTDQGIRELQAALPNCRINNEG